MHSIFVDFIALDFSAVGKIIHLDNLPIQDLVFSLGILLYYPARSRNATECISPPAIPLRYILQEALTFVLFLLLKLLLTGCIFTTLETDNTGKCPCNHCLSWDQ